jgi:AGZA family xanthine/uracil permease-like MFS transporter
MAPEYQRTQSFMQAWEAGIFAAIMTGVLQMCILPLLPFLQQTIPKAALLASVSGIALTFLSMGFAFEIWQHPLIAIGPLFLYVCIYLSIYRSLYLSIYLSLSLSIYLYIYIYIYICCGSIP